MHRACYVAPVRLLRPEVVVGTLALALGCGGGNEAYVRSQAVADMSCQPEKTIIVDAEVGMYKVRGCGQEAGYRCPEMGSHCRRMYLTPLAEQSDETAPPGEQPAGEP